jgi:arsenate reductase-like glutaredoxin family protein
VGIDKLCNTTGTTYRRLKLDFKQMAAHEKFNVLLREQSMIRRPLLEKAGSYHVGFDEMAIGSFVEQNHDFVRE